MHPTVERFQERLRELGAAGAARELPNSSHTATEAAEELGTTVGQIVKSLVFLAGETPIMVLASGANQVDTEKLAVLTGEPVGRAGAKTVREATGYAIGGVPPVAHATRMRIFLDRDLLTHAELWAAAGTPNAVFPTNPDELVAITHGEWADLKIERC
jgi:prolyl-tRNA editing enzyme YbaK/EbsC (Cys-tRNA(Pro) deacylase)